MPTIQPTYQGQNLEFWRLSIIYCKNNLIGLQHYPQSQIDLANRIGIIIHTWILIEGFTKEVVWDHLIQLSMEDENNFNELQEFAEKVKASDWKVTKAIAKDNGLDFPNTVDADLWRTICKINDFRNAIFHSNDLRIMFAYNNNYTKPETIQHFQDALDHFKNPRIGVMDKTKLRGNNFDEMINEIFNSTFLNYIFKEAKEYCLTIGVGSQNGYLLNRFKQVI